MKTGINVDFIAGKVGMEKAAKYVADAGFKYVDYTPPLKEDNWEAIMKEHLKIIEANGLIVHQTHTPFNRYGSYGDKHTLYIERCMEATAYMGAEFTAVHGDEFDFENKHYVVGALVEGDTINEDGLYIYRSIIEGDDFKVEKIAREFDYKRIAKAYMEMDE